MLILANLTDNNCLRDLAFVAFSCPSAKESLSDLGYPDKLKVEENARVVGCFWRP